MTYYCKLTHAYYPVEKILCYVYCREEIMQFNTRSNAPPPSLYL